MPGQDHKPDEFDNVPRRDESPQEAGEFTRAFGGRTDQNTQDDTSAEEGLSPTPGSLAQLLGGKSKMPPPPQTDRLEHPPSAVPVPPESRPDDSFTKAFDGVNAFTRDPMDLGETNFDSQASKHPCPDVTPPQSPGSFTRLFGSGEGVLTPSGTAESSQPPLPREFRETVGGLPRGSQPPSGSVRNRPSIPPANEPSGFTQAFPPPSVPEPPESKAQPGSFTKEFGSPPSWRSPEPPPSSTTAQAYIPGPGGTLHGYNGEPVLPSNPQHPPAPAGGFTRLIDPLQSGSILPEPAPPSDVPSMRPARRPEYPASDFNYTSRGSAAGDGATVAFNQSGRPEPEVAAPQGKSDYTRVVEASRFRAPSEPCGAGSSPTPSAASAAPPALLQYPSAPPTPAWPPAPAAAAPPVWGQPPVVAPLMPQAPAVAAPALPLQPPTLGDKLVSFLPLMLALTVINFLGMLAVLIILFATRK